LDIFRSIQQSFNNNTSSQFKIYDAAVQNKTNKKKTIAWKNVSRRSKTAPKTCIINQFSSVLLLSFSPSNLKRERRNGKSRRGSIKREEEKKGLHETRILKAATAAH
jgi:hypothetical protein